ncbi:DinB family protein [Christiangramia sp. SM2212]|uniref:DinB family protein n=1 Tax=Christiangramia sediminicola TaxID=3073267 RepID=A0ABU1ER19_9FLAO|nr:DinB family protein [Christiangramia sp. SM2212]MDR5590838.1 DinB family protein [Christiangramia sp. SM2212]
MKTGKTERDQLVKHLEGGLAYASIESFLDAIPFDKVGVRPKGLPYSFYEVFYHMFFAQKDILNYAVADDYQPHNWPDDYWPENPFPESEEDWEDLKADFFEDRRLLKELILNEEKNLSEPVQNSKEHSLFREILLVIEHSAYHTGQLLIIQRLLGIYDN